MKFSARRTVRPGDEARAAEVVKTERRVLENYKDYQAALRGGFEIFMPNLPQVIYHFTNYRYALEAEVCFNPEHPNAAL